MTQIFTYPDNIVPDSLDWRIQYNTQAFISPFGRTTQTAESPGARWSARMNYSNLQQSELRELVAFFIQLRGMSGRFSLYDLSLPDPQLGTKADTTVTGANRTTVTLADATGLTVGDYMEINPTHSETFFVNSGPELKMITEINGSVITFEPPFRVVPENTNPVTFTKPKCNFMLDTDDQTGWTASGSIHLSNFTVSCVEMF